MRGTAVKKISKSVQSISIKNIFQGDNECATKMRGLVITLG